MKYFVVVVDDSKFIHKIIGNFVDPKLFDVRFFVSAEEAKKTMGALPLQGREVDLVLLDIYLQDGTKDSSLELLKFLTRERRRTQVIVMSGRLSAEEFGEFYSHGAANYLLKPFAEDKFMTAVQRHVRLARNTPEYQNQPLAKIKVDDRQVFISFLAGHEKIACFFRDELMKNDIGSWCEQAELLEDPLWKTVLLEAINTCKIFILLLTRDSLQSAYMKQEIIQAFNRKKQEGNRFVLLPVLYNIKENQVPQQIRSMYCFDITSANNRAEQIHSLISSVTKKIRSMG
ncbi:response regulator [Candidatus Electrothrix sp.]|uniref:response regulator n=1 Tax=Candidatus Electrothrix sp. TaxID=2170559 RepID=UPI00405734EA